MNIEFLKKWWVMHENVYHLYIEWRSQLLQKLNIPHTKNGSWTSNTNITCTMVKLHDYIPLLSSIVSEQILAIKSMTFGKILCDVFSDDYDPMTEIPQDIFQLNQE